MSETIELCEEELDIIGDIDKNEEPFDVTIYCKGDCSKLTSVLLYIFSVTAICP